MHNCRSVIGQLYSYAGDKIYNSNFMFNFWPFYSVQTVEHLYTNNHHLPFLVCLSLTSVHFLSLCHVLFVVLIALPTLFPPLSVPCSPVIFSMWMYTSSSVQLHPLSHHLSSFLSALSPPTHLPFHQPFILSNPGFLPPLLSSRGVTLPWDKKLIANTIKLPLWKSSRPKNQRPSASVGKSRICV